MEMHIQDKDKAVKIFSDNYPYEDTNLSSRYRLAVLRILTTFLRAEGVLSAPIVQQNFSKNNNFWYTQKNYSFYDCCAHLMAVIAMVCERVDHGNKLEEKPVTEALEMVYFNLDSLFLRQNIKIPWQLIPQALAH